MKRERIVRYSADELRAFTQGDTGTDWGRVRQMTEEEVEANARSDPDNPPLTDEEVAEFERVPNTKAIRKKLHMTQRQFAQTFRLSLGAVRDWEQGRVLPDRTTQTLLKVIAYRPDIVQEALENGGENRNPQR